MKEDRAPYACHVLVCVNDRQGARKSCADGQSTIIRERLKEAVAQRGWAGRVRVSQTGCLGLCQKGPNIMLYPQGIWWSEATPDDCEAVIQRIAEILEKAAAT